MSNDVETKVDSSSNDAERENEADAGADTVVNDQGEKVVLDPSPDDGGRENGAEGEEEAPVANGVGESTDDKASEASPSSPHAEQAEAAQVEAEGEGEVEGEGGESNLVEAADSGEGGESNPVEVVDSGEAVAGQTLPVIRPILRGTYDDAEGVWAGEWAMSEAEFESGLKGKFEYKREKKVPDEHVGKPPMVDGQPNDLYVSGYFMLLQKDNKFKKVMEKDILMRFVAAEDGSIVVQGFGKNSIGEFSLSGTFDPSTSALNMEREYQKTNILAQVKSAQKKKAATPRATPRVLPHSGGDLTWGSAGGAPSLSGPAAAVSQRVRRAPPRIDDAEVDTNRQSTQRMLSIVDKLLKADVHQFFHVPVDPVALGIPHYLTIITEPMDLGTVRQNIVNGVSENEDQVAEHIVLTFRNAMTFNEKGTIVYNDAKNLLGLFETERSKLAKRPAAHEKDKKRKSTGGGLVDSKRSKSLGRQQSMRSEDSADDEDYEEPSVTYAKPTKSGRRSAPAAHYDPYHQQGGGVGGGMENEEIRLLRRQMEMMTQQLESLKAVTMQSQIGFAAPSPRGAAMMDMDYLAPAPAPKRPRAPPKPKQPRASSYAAASSPLADFDEEYGAPARSAPKPERPFSFQEKKALGEDINKLPADKQARVVEIISESGSQMFNDGAEEVEIDIEKLDNATLRALQKYVREVLRGEKRKG